MKRNLAIMALVMLALLSACKNPAGSNTSEQPDSYTINVVTSGNVQGDSVTASPTSGTVGDEITISYSVANSAVTNQLVFSGTNPVLAQVNSASSGTRKYTIAEEDAVNGFITIKAVFTHSNPEPISYTIAINKSGNVEGDSVTASPTSGTAGTEITLNYTVANDKANNRLVFSGTQAAIEKVDSAEDGTRKYTITEADAAKGAITINALFSHSDKEFDTIEFANASNETRAYGAPSFTKAITNTGTGSGAITYLSSEQNVATVNNATGEVTIRKVGTTTITATKAGDTTYEDATAKYTLTVTPLQLTITAPNVTTTKPYDGTTTAVVITAGALTNKVSNDAVTVSAAANYNSPDVGTNKTITVVYDISGADAGNYLKPLDYTVSGTITNVGGTNKQDGAAVSGSPASASTTINSITITAVTISPNPGNQTVEYAISTAASPVPTSGWQAGLTFSGLTPNTNYYVFARSKENENYKAGEARVSAAIKTQAATIIEVPRTTIVDFEADAIDKTYGFTKGGSSPTVKVVADPQSSGQKSLQISSGGYNQAAVIPFNLPVELHNYKSFSFRFRLASGSANLGNQSIMVYVAKSTGDFKDHGFGNPAGGSNPEFADKLLGSASTNIDDTFKTKWTDYTITISNPGDAIKNLKGDIFVAIGINTNTSNAILLFDDLKFEMKDDYNPPPIVILPGPTPPTIGAVSSGNYRNMFVEWGRTEAEVSAKVTATYNKLFVNGTADEKIFVEVGSDMAYIYTADTDDVRSEGMSYGMMMCVQMDDQARFDKLWKWAKTYMYNTTNTGGNNRGYFSWKRNTNGSGGDANPAPDGEEYFVTALLFASARWGDGTGDFNYGKWARQVLYDMVHRTPNGSVDPYSAPTMFNLTEKQVVFVPIGESAKHTDPSYHLPAFYEIWALELENDWKNNQLSGIWSSQAELKTDFEFYKAAAATSRAFFPKTTNATTGLGPDYAEFNGAPRNQDPHNHFEYDAWRIAMNIGMDYAWWAADPWQVTFANRIQAFFVGKGVTTYGNRWTLDGTQRGADHSPGLVGCNAVASLAATHENAWKFIEDFWNISMTKGTYRYYDGCLYMFGMLHLSGNFKAYLSTNTTPIASSSISPTTATFDKKTNQQADIAVTMTLNGNSLTSISNGGTALTSGTNYTVSGNGDVKTVTINKSYLSTLAVGTTTLTFEFSAGAARNLVITVVDTSNSSITPTTATFDKRSDLQSDITVTMTLNGNTLSSISTGGTTLTSGNQYTVTGSGDVKTVTINKSYLSTLTVGTTATLTFTFNAGAPSSLVITVKESPAGGGTGTSYNFASDTFLAGYPKYSGTGITATITGGVLQVKKTSSMSTESFVISFNVGIGGNISNFSGIKLNIRGVDGDYTNKDFRVWSGTTTSTQLGSVASSLSTSFKDITVSLSGSLAANASGIIEIGFGFPNANAYVYEIKSIELIPK